MSNSTGSRLLGKIKLILSQLANLSFFTHNKPRFVQGVRSSWGQKTKKGAQHAQRQMSLKSAVGIYSKAYSVHWLKA